MEDDDETLVWSWTDIPIDLKEVRNIGYTCPWLTSQLSIRHVDTAPK